MRKKSLLSKIEKQVYLNKNLIDFKIDGVVCLKRFENGRWALEWTITPETIK
jgi:hypothetical protein